MRTTGKWRLLALFAVFAMVLAACGTDDAVDTTAAPEEAAATDEPAEEPTEEPSEETEPPAEEPAEGGGGIVSTYIGEPEWLQPANTNESEGSAVLAALFTGLIESDPVTSEPTFTGVAESITSDDGGLTWNVALREGWTFHDGTPVNASSFVDAWNYAAYGPNAAQVSGFMAPIAGYADLQCGTVTQTNDDGEDEEVADCEGAPPAADALSGLEVVDDLNFTVTLNEAESFFPQRLVYTAYYPAPQAFFDDPAAFNEQPIGNGPFMMDGAWEHDVRIMTTAYPDYAGENAAQIEGLEFRIYEDVNTAINDLEAGNLDIVDAVVAERLDEVKGIVPNFGESPSSSINYIGLPSYVGYLEDVRIRQALSMAIDREALVSSPIFNGTRQAAHNLLSPVIPGYEDDVCPAWNYDPEGAKALWDEAGGITEPITFWFNSGAGHDQWVEAVVNFWAQNLGLDVASVSFEQLDFADYLPKIDGREITGPFRLGWGMDYPHPQNYLQLLLDSRFAAPVGSNSSIYENPDFDAKIDEANAQTDINDALPLYQEAAEIACNDVPVIPMFYGLNQYAWNDTVDNVYVDAFSRVVYTDLTTTG